jgi:chaperonin GroES
MTTLPFRPIQDLVVVAKSKVERLLASGIVIPHVDDDAERQLADDRDVAVVLGVGDGKLLAEGERRKMSVAVGDKVVFGRNKGQSVRYGEVDYLVLREAHLIGRIVMDAFQPLGGYIVAEAVTQEQTTDAGVIVPEAADDREEADVLQVGPGEILADGRRDVPIVRPGDRVLFNPRMAEPFLHGGRELLAMRQDHIVCVSNRDA